MGTNLLIENTTSLKFRMKFFCYCFFARAFLFKASSFSVTFKARFSASASMGFQSFFFTASIMRSVSDGSLSMASVNRFSAASSLVTISRASSGHVSMHLGSPLQKSHAITIPVSGWRTIPPCGHAWMHQSQPLHFFSLIIRMPVFSDWTRAFSGQALTHWASSQNRHVSAKLNIGIMRTLRILDLNGLAISPFSSVQAYSHIPQPVHLLGSTETNFLSVNFGCCIFP